MPKKSSDNLNGLSGEQIGKLVEDMAMNPELRDRFVKGGLGEVLRAQNAKNRDGGRE